MTSPPGSLYHFLVARVRVLATLLPLLLMLPVGAHAASAPRVLLDVLVGWNGVAREDRFAPVIVSVTTPGAQVSAEVRVDVTWGSSLRGTQESRSFTRHEVFAAGGLRRLSFVVPVPSDARTLTASVLDAAGQRLAGADVDLREAAVPDRLVAAVSSTLSLDALAGLSGTSGAVRVVYPRVDDLPDSWGGYDGLDMVVVHDTYFRQLREAQVSALERWVVAGGVLVFTGGAAGLQHAGAGFDRLLPVQVTGIREVDSLPSLAAAAGRPDGPRGKVTIAEATLKEGSVIADQAGLPLLVRRAMGRGSIWFMAVDPTLPPFTTWPGTLALWRTVDARDRRGAIAPPTRSPAEDAWMAVLLSSPALAFPSPLVVLVFCGLYSGLLFALVTAGRRLRISPGARGGLFALLTVAACIAGWLLFNRGLFHPEPALLDASVAEVRSGDDLAWVVQKTGIFASRPGVLGLSFDAPDVLVEELEPSAGLPRQPGEAETPLTVEEGGGVGTRVPTLALGRYGSRLVIATGVVPFPVSISVAADPTTPRLTVANASGLWLRDAFFWKRGYAWRVGDVAPDSGRSVPLVSDQGVDVRTPGALRTLAGSDRQVSFWNLASAEAGAEAGVLAAWLDQPGLRFTASAARQSPDRPPLSLLLVEAVP